MNKSDNTKLSIMGADAPLLQKSAKGPLPSTLLPAGSWLPGIHRIFATQQLFTCCHRTPPARYRRRSGTIHGPTERPWPGTVFSHLRVKCNILIYPNIIPGMIYHPQDDISLDKSLKSLFWKFSHLKNSCLPVSLSKFDDVSTGVLWIYGDTLA